MLKRSTTVIVMVAALVIALDRVTKLWAVHSLTPGVSESAIPNLLWFTLLTNSGAAFSTLSNATWIFTFFSSAVSVYVLFKSPRIVDRWWQLAAGGILGGAVGNLIDRFFNEPGFGRGRVIDFLELPHWPVFNVADSSVVLSACVLFVMALLGRNYDGTRNHESSR